MSISIQVMYVLALMCPALAQQSQPGSEPGGGVVDAVVVDTDRWLVTWYGCERCLACDECWPQDDGSTGCNCWVADRAECLEIEGEPVEVQPLELTFDDCFTGPDVALAFVPSMFECDECVLCDGACWLQDDGSWGCKCRLADRAECLEVLQCHDFDLDRDHDVDEDDRPVVSIEAAMDNGTRKVRSALRR